MDLIDRAQSLEALHRDAAMAAHQARPIRIGDSAEHCIDPQCGASIPEGRRIAIPGVQFCIDCQTRRERQERKEY